MALKPFCWKGPNFYASQTPHFFDAEMTRVPLAFTEKFRHNVSLPLPFLLLAFGSNFLEASGISRLPSFRLGQ